MRKGTFRAHLQRAFSTPMLYVCILVYTAMLLSGTFGSRMEGGNAIEELKNAQNSFARILSTVIPALAYAVTYVDDYDTRLLQMWVMRSGSRKYALSYYATSVITGFFVSFIGCMLFVGIMLLRGLPLDRGIVTNVYRAGIAWYTMLYLKNAWAYTLVVVLEYALGCAAMAGFAAFCSSLFHQRVSTLGMPVLYFYLDEIFSKLEKYIPGMKVLRPDILDGNHLLTCSYYVEDMYFLAPLDMHNFLFKVVAVVLHIVVFGTLSVWIIERSVEHA